MATIARSLPRAALIGGVIVLLLILGLGGAFLRLGMNAAPPVQTMVHKDLSAATFAAPSANSAAANAPLPAMPPVPATSSMSAPMSPAPVPSAPQMAASPTAGTPAVAAPVLTPSTPLPTMPAPKAAPAQPMPAAPAH